MADTEVNIEMRERNANNDGWIIKYPKTKGSQVVAADGTTTFESHLSDNVKHITSEERTTWNGKQDALAVENRRKITYGTADPSGGSDGDIYLQYNA